jgi:hypothetical protein
VKASRSGGQGTDRFEEVPLALTDPEVRARTLEDQPYGTIEAINGVTIALAIRTTPAGELEIKYAARRDGEDGEAE